VSRIYLSIAMPRGLTFERSLLQDVRTNTRDMKFAVDGLASDFKDVKSMINSVRHPPHVSENES
jgi:hypothetical protein